MDGHFTDSEYLRRLSTLEKTGWWELDLTKNEILFSEYICEYLGLLNPLKLDQFIELIDEEYRKEIECFLSSTNFSSIFEKIFLIKTATFSSWVRFYYDFNIGQPDNGQKIFGSLKILSETIQSRERSFQRNLYKYMPLGYVRLTAMYNADGKANDFCIMEINKFAADLCGKQETDLVGCSMAELLGNEYNPITSNVLQNALNKVSHREFDRYFSPSGKSCRCLVYSPEPDEVVMLCMDVTEVKQTSLELEKSSYLLQNIFAIMPVGIEVYDKDAKLVDLNIRDMELFGIKDKSEVLGNDFFKSREVPKDFYEWIKLNGNFVFSYDYKLKRSEEASLPVRKRIFDISAKVFKIYDADGEYQGFLLMNNDNTGKLLSANRITEFEQLFSLISGYAKVGYSKLNAMTSDGYAIKQWYKNNGENENTPISTIVGKYPKMHPDDREYVLEFYEKAKRREATYFQREVRVRRPGTENEWNWIRMHIILNAYEPENNLVELIGINYDVTEVKETEFKLIEAKERAEAANQLKTAFLANISHEIRTPLNAIVGFSTLLVESNNPVEKKEFQQIIEDNNGHLLKIVSNLLDLSKIEANKLDIFYTQFDFNVLCQNVIQSISSLMNSSVSLFFEPEFSQCDVISDYSCLHQVLTNLLDNAIKFTPKGTIHLGYKVEGELLRVYVRDSGIGVASEKTKNVFDRFIKLNTYTQGVGLGLSICKSIIEQLGGEIGVESEVGKGSCFWFTIPLSESIK